MNVLLIGGGGREHAMALAMYKSPSTKDIYAAPGNPGILEIAKKAELDVNNHAEVVKFCKVNAIELVAVGPEQPLADGLADELRSNDIAVFGPDKEAAMLEASKDFAKQIMKKYNVPTAAFQTFSVDKREEAHTYIDAGNFPIVLKADGLAGGKGVLIPETIKEAHDNLDTMFDGLFGSASNTIVIEEFMEGEEASIFAICDGDDFITLAPSQDHKRAFDGDLGKNTGGMGAYAPAPIVSYELLNQVKSEVIAPVLAGMKAEGKPFIGCLYVGVMIKDNYAKVVEFNVRFGDPETQAVLSLFEGDFTLLIHSAAEGEIESDHVTSIADKVACCVVMSSKGYPDVCESGFEIKGLAEASNESCTVYQAGTAEKDGKIVSNGGRILGVTGVADSLEEAISVSYESVAKLSFTNHFFRKDIGMKGLK